MSSVLTAITVISLVALFLTVLILVVDATIGNYGTCRIDINDGEKVLEVQGGSSLLNSLKQEGIFIPSACGGKGSCGLCVIKVLEGAPEEHLATELPWLDEEQRKQNLRLSCQIKVKNDMKIDIPEEYFLIKEFRTRISSIRDLTHDIKEVRLKLVEPDTIKFKAGQFVQILVPEYEMSSEEVYRAYSISSPPSEKSELELEIRLVPNGICTTYVHKFLKEGDNLTITGPYGDFYLRDTDREIVFVAGGSGMAPVKSILLDMKDRGIDRKMTYFFGAVMEKDLFLVDEMKELESEFSDFRFVPALSDPEEGGGWDGETGLITEVIESEFDDGSEAEAYLCGSPGMIDAAVEVLKDKKFSEDRIFYDKFE